MYPPYYSPTKVPSNLIQNVFPPRQIPVYQTVPQQYQPYGRPQYLPATPQILQSNYAPQVLQPQQVRVIQQPQYQQSYVPQQPQIVYQQQQPIYYSRPVLTVPTQHQRVVSQEILKPIKFNQPENGENDKKEKDIAEELQPSDQKKKEPQDENPVDDNPKPVFIPKNPPIISPKNNQLNQFSPIKPQEKVFSKSYVNPLIQRTNSRTILLPQQQFQPQQPILMTGSRIAPQQVVSRVIYHSPSQPRFLSTSRQCSQPPTFLPIQSQIAQSKNEPTKKPFQSPLPQKFQPRGTMSGQPFMTPQVNKGKPFNPSQLAQNRNKVPIFDQKKPVQDKNNKKPNPKKPVQQEDDQDPLTKIGKTISNLLDNILSI